jgi:hypothetical protein
LRDISREKLAVERYQFVAIIMVVKLTENVPDILTLQDKPGPSPDLNPLDYFVCGYMLSKID